MKQKTKLKTMLALAFSGSIAVFQMQAQTYGYGKLTVGTTTCTATGTSGDCSDTYIGNAAGASNTGANNSYFGDHAGTSNGAGTRNTFLGASAGYSNVRFDDNIAIGYKALFWQSTLTVLSTYNLAIGNYALYTNSPTGTTNGINNTAVGHNSLYLNTIGTSNSALGFEAMKNNTTAGQNVALGFQALHTQSYSLTTTYNTAVGYQALYSNQPTASANTGTSNTAIGHLSLYTNNTGYQNTASGGNALSLNTTGYNNSAHGQAALYRNTTGINNTANGFDALFNNCNGGTVGDFNTATASQALFSNTSGDYNTAEGYQALYANTTGGYNTAVGVSAQLNNTTGSNNTCIGYAADVTNSGWSNCTAIGNGASVTNNGDFVLGNSSVTNLRCQQQTILALSDRRVKNNIKENVPGLAFINLLKPVTYHFDIHKQNSIEGYRMKRDSVGNATNEVDTTYWEGKYDIEKVQYSGFIAQQVDSAAQQIGYDFSGVHRPSNAKDLYGLGYTTIVVPLVKAVQELSHIVDSLKNAGHSSMRMGNPGTNSDSLNRQDIKLRLPDGATLGEPQPNPNNGSTQIPYYLPQNTSGAKVIFTDMLGKVMEERVLQPGYGLLNVDTQDLPAGVYSYSLIVNGKVIDNKKMMRNN